MDGRHRSAQCARVFSSSITTKLYAIFALLATACVGLAGVAVVNSRWHATLTQQYEAAAQGTQRVERVKMLVYGARLESRGIFMSTDEVATREFTEKLRRYDQEIGRLIGEWQAADDNPDDAGLIAALLESADAYRKFLGEVVKNAGDYGLKVASNLKDVENDQQIRRRLDGTLDSLGAVYLGRATSIYAQIDGGIADAALVTSSLAAFAVLLALVGVVLIR